MVGSAGRHTDRRRPLALPGAAVSHGVLPVMAWEGPGSRPCGTAPRTTNATVPLWRKNARAEGRAGAHGRDAPWQHGGPWPRVTALRGTWCMRGPGASCEESAWLQGERHATGRSARERRARRGANSAGEPSGLICVTNRPMPSHSTAEFISICSRNSRGSSTWRTRSSSRVGRGSTLALTVSSAVAASKLKPSMAGGRPRSGAGPLLCPPSGRARVSSWPPMIASRYTQLALSKERVSMADMVVKVQSCNTPQSFL